jgi:hypothetical protein
VIRGLKTRNVLLPLVAICLAQPASVRACAACYGQSNSPLALGLNWGIFSLLGVVAVVLGSIAGFFIYLARRSQAAGSPPGPGSQPSIDRTQNSP